MASRAKRAGAAVPCDRRGLQRLGEHLDRDTEGTWVAQDLAPSIADLPRDALIVVDAVRLRAQVDAMREAFGRDVLHLHLYAPHEELAARYEARAAASEIRELSSYDEVAVDPTEAQIQLLATDADVAIDTKRCSPEDVEVRAAAEIGLLDDSSGPTVDVLVGGGYGSEGKGNIAFFLAREYDILVRVGGPNAGHKVPMRSPMTHRLLPSGTLANDEAQLVIGPGAILNVNLLLAEINDCNIEVGRLAIDPGAMVIEPYDIDLERRLVARIGSTGQGVGSATARRVLDRGGARTEVPPVRFAADIPALTPYVRPSAEILREAYALGQRVLLEGTQGTALSLYHGSYPHVTSRDTTAAGCIAEAGIAPRRVRRVIVVCRTFPIRVRNGEEGSSGPMSQELSWEQLADRSGVPLEEILEAEKGSVSGKQRRVSEFDWALLRKAVELNGATDVALTFADYIDVANRDARRFDQLTPDTMRFIHAVERVARVPVSLIATRFAVRSIIDRRQWT